MIKRKYFLFVLGLVLISLVSAELDMTINIKKEFNVGEQIIFDYSLLSSEDVEIVFYPYVSCPELLGVPIQTSIFSLEKKAPFLFFFS